MVLIHAVGEEARAEHIVTLDAIEKQSISRRIAGSAPAQSYKLGWACRAR